MKVKTPTFKTCRNLSSQSLDWNFFKPVTPRNLKLHFCRKSSINIPMTNTETTGVQSRQSTNKLKLTPASQTVAKNSENNSDIEDEKNDNDEIRPLFNTAILTNYYNMYKQLMDRKTGLSLKYNKVKMWDIKNEKPVKICKKPLLAYKTRIVNERTKIEDQNKRLAIKKFPRTLPNLLNLENMPEKIDEISLTKKFLGDHSPNSPVSPTRSKAFQRKSSWSLVQIDTKPKTNRWRINLDNGIRNLLTDYEKTINNLHVAKQEIIKKIKIKSKPIQIIRPFNISLIKPKEDDSPENEKMKPLVEKLKDLSHKVSRNLKDQERNSEIGILKQNMKVMLTKSNELTKWCINLHKIRGNAEKDYKQSPEEFIKKLKRGYSIQY